jgi:uncharacterized membrane protein
VSLAGTMMALAVNPSMRSKHRFSYFAIRAAFLLSVGALVDILAWKFVPFIGFDVLYLLGFSLPLLFFSAHLKPTANGLLAISVFALTPLLQYFFGYAQVPLTLGFTDASAVLAVEYRTVLKHWLIDGWFPIFPWLGYGFFGVFIGQWRWHASVPVRTFAPIHMGFIGALFCGGAFAMYLFPGPLYSRGGFSELFYPATLGFISLSIAVFLGLIAFVDRLPLRPWSVFQVFGEASLFMYVIHSLVIGMVIASIWPTLSVLNYALLYAILVAGLGLCGLGLRRLRKQYPGMPILLKWVVGG